MFLRELHVENFRAIRRASLRLDATTTLIGENDCGRGSLLRALDLVLGRSDGVTLSDADFHREPGATAPAGAIRIILVFEERVAGEWSHAWHAPLGTHLQAGQGGDRRLVLEATAAPPAVNGGLIPLTLQVNGARGSGAREALVEHVRAMTPLIHIEGGALTGRERWALARGSSREAPTRAHGPLAPLVERVLDTAGHLLGGTGIDFEEDVELGAQAARELLARSPRHFDPDGAGLASSVLEILGTERVTGADAPRPPSADIPALADRLGTLLLLAAILRHFPEGVAPGAEPLWVIEEPDAHLHPMTLAAAGRLLERIRWQKIVTTHSGDLLATMPLGQIRRLVRHRGTVAAAGLRPRVLSREHLRRVGYHLRMHRGVAMFARVWLLVEGESEIWILPQVAQVMGYNLPLEGVCCVSFAQCGLDPLVRTAREFGIEWHVLADGDEAGRRYADAARAFTRRVEESDRITFLAERDIEHCFWHGGHSATIMEVAGLSPGLEQRVRPTQAIAKAVQRRSKPFLALSLVESVARRGPDGVPEPLARLIETCVRLARHAPARTIAAMSR